MRRKTLTNYKKRIIKEEVSRLLILSESKRRLNRHDYRLIQRAVDKYGINALLEDAPPAGAPPAGAPPAGAPPAGAGGAGGAGEPSAAYKQARDRIKKWAAAKRNKITGELTKDMTDEGALFFLEGPGKGMQDLQNDIDRADFVLRNTNIFSEDDLDAAGTYLYFKLGESTFFKLYDGDLSKGEVAKPKSQKQPDGGAPPPAPQGGGQAGAGVPPQIRNMEDDFENPKAPGIFTSILDSYKYAFGANANMWKGIYNWFGKAEKAPPARQDDLLLQLLMKIMDKMNAKGGEAAAKADEIEKEVEDIIDEPGEEEGGLSKETPVSVMKKQTDVVVGKDGQKETPLVMHLQKAFKINQSSAQKIAKRIGKYLQQRKIPIAEGIRSGLVDRLMRKAIASDKSGLLMESKKGQKAINSLKSAFRGKLKPLMLQFQDGEDQSKEKMKAASDLLLKVHNLAKKKDKKAFQQSVTKWAKQGIIGTVSTQWLKGESGFYSWGDFEDEDWEKLFDDLTGKTSDVWKKYHLWGKDFREAVKTGKLKKRGELRGMGKEAGVIGKIVTRFIGDEQEMLEKDDQLKAIFDDPPKFKKFVKSVANILRRMLKRRGYESAELVKLGFLAKEPKKAEKVVAEHLRRYYNTNILRRR